MKAIKILAQGGSENIEIENTPEALQQEVGAATLETVTLIPGCVMLVDEDGRMKCKPYNRKASVISGVSIVGDALVVGTEGEEFTDVPEQIVTILAHIFEVRGGAEE